MMGQYVFELQFKGKTDGPSFKPKESQFVVIDGESMADLSKLQADLSKCTPELFRLQYIDDENDVISIDTEEEFKEFAKWAKHRSSRGLLIRLIINTNIPAEVSDQKTQTSARTEEAIALQEATEDGAKNIASEPLFSDAMLQKTGLSELKKKIKSELKKEILFEMRNEMMTEPTLIEDPECEEDSDGGFVYLRDKRRIKLLNCQKKLEKKEKHYETKIDQRLEKLEMKKKKMLEKASLRTAVNRKTLVESKVGVPYIMSAIQSNESVTLGKRVTVGKVFFHVWHLINDGTVAWTNVELRHFWSSVGLEPDELSLKCPPITPGQEGHLTMKFKAPKTVGSFMSYWYLFYQVDSQWQQFGHYISLSGNTKPSKHAALAASPKDISKKLKDVTRTITFNEDTRAGELNEATVKEDPKVVCRFRKEANLHHGASLASSEIAAEMAREAANAAFRLANCKEPIVSSTPNGLDKLNDAADVAVEFVQLLNVVDSGSDTEANNDTNEETDPGFVMVDVPTCFYTDDRNQQPEKIPVNVLEVSSTVLKEINKMPLAKEVEENTEVLKTEKKDDERVIHDKIYEKSCQPTEENNKNVQESCYSENEERGQADTAYENIDEPQLPISFPNVNYPLFPARVPIPVYATQQPIPHHHAPHGYPVFPAQNTSSHAVVFPPPPMDYFTTPKINPPIHYPQIPTYPPMSGCSHPIPLISTGLAAPSAIPTQSAMAPPPQITPPAPIPQQMVRTFPIPPVMMRYGNPHVQTTPAASVKYEPKTTADAVTSTYSSSSARTNQIFESIPENVAPFKESSFTAATTTQELINKSETMQTRVDAGVQILPQSLVKGAISVASTAYSTACNALNNLRTKDETIEFDPVFENNMALLVDMGFYNLERNGRLLKKYNNDVSHVISVICAYDKGELPLDDLF